MTDEPYYQRVEREAAENLMVLLAKPLPETSDDIGGQEFFDPWDLFPALYGSYSSDFDELAIEILNDLNRERQTFDRRDLAAEMFREMLCTANLCDYGSSPRVCFPNTRFKEILPALIDKWKAYSAMHWLEREQ